MGKQEIPKFLGKKLKIIRQYKGLTQQDMCEIVAAPNRAQISKYESGQSLPPTSVLKKYINYVKGDIAVNISSDNLIFDELDLPKIFDSM